MCSNELLPILIKWNWTFSPTIKSGFDLLSRNDRGQCACCFYLCACAIWFDESSLRFSYKDIFQCTVKMLTFIFSKDSKHTASLEFLQSAHNINIEGCFHCSHGIFFLSCSSKVVMLNDVKRHMYKKNQHNLFFFHPNLTIKIQFRKNTSCFKVCCYMGLSPRTMLVYFQFYLPCN